MHASLKCSHPSVNTRYSLRELTIYGLRVMERRSEKMTPISNSLGSSLQDLADASPLSNQKEPKVTVFSAFPRPQEFQQS